MKIPGEKSNEGADRLQFYQEIIDACFYSLEKRKEQYEVLKQYYLYGAGPESDPTPYNKIDPTVDTLSAFLYSADSTRFSTHLPPEVDGHEWAKARVISQAVNSAWVNSGSDQIFGQALDWSLVYNSTLVKLVVNGGHTVPYVVDPDCFGVYREDINGIDRQEAIAHRYYITRSQLEAELQNHPSRAKILANLKPRPIQQQDDMPSGLRRIIVTNLAGVPPLTPGNNVMGNGTLLMSERIDYKPGVSADVIEMTELWIRDDDEGGDYRTVTMAEGPVVIYDRPNIFVQGEQPFTQVCPMPMHGYFWGASFAGKIIGLQGWRNVRIGEIMHMLSKQAHPPTSLQGFSGIVDETAFALDQPGGVLNNTDPMGGKTEQFAPAITPDIWHDVQMIDEMISEAAGLPPLLMGRGETGVRSGRQTSELSRLGSSRTKKRALAIEDNLETLATKMFKAMRRFDDTVYTSEPLTPDDKPIKFILNQAPADAVVRVDAHSNSPLFVEDQKALAGEMLEAHSIGRDSFIEMLNPPQKDILLRRLKTIEKNEADAAKAKAQHEEQLAGAKHAPPGVPHAGLQAVKK